MNEQAAPSDGRRLAQLYDISKLFTAFSSVEETLDAALQIAARTLRLESAILIQAVIGGHADMIVWHAEGTPPERVPVSKRHAEESYAYLVGARSTDMLDLREEQGPSRLPVPAGRSSPSERFIVIPLVVGRAGVFGVLQVEGAVPLDRDDLEFVNAVGNQLAVALDRDRVWRHDILRRRDAQESRAAYESLVDHLDRAFVWEVDPETHQLCSASSQIERMFGQPRHQCLQEANWWHAHGHTEDRHRFERALARAVSEPGEQRLDHRCVTSAGTVIWLHTSLHLSAEARAPGRVHGVSYDVTETKAAQLQLREQLLVSTAIAASLGEGTIAIDVEGTITFINEAATDLLGCSPREAIGRRTAQVTHFENGDGVRIESPLSVAMRTGICTRGDDDWIVRADGRRFPVSYTAAAIRRDGLVTGAVLAFDDISERRAAREMERFLLGAGAALSTSLESTAVARAIAGLGVPLLGDICFVDVVASDGHPSRVAWAHRDLAAQQALDLLLGGAAHPSLLSKPILDVISTNRSLRVPIVSDAWFSADDLPLARRLGIRRALIVPMSTGARPVGALTFCVLDEREHGDREIALAEELARRCALAIEHAHLYESAKRAVALRDQTLAVVSHDLRAPLTTIMMAASLLRDGKIERSTRWTKAMVIDKIQTAAARMERLIEDLLDFANIDVGRLAIVKGAHDVASIIEESRASFEDVARKCAVRLSADLPPNMPPIECDRDRIVQVIANLVGNALNVVKPGDCVSLRAKSHGHEAVFSVTDTGPGVPPDEQNRLFDRYWRSPSPTYLGSGLGLAIARGIVEAHDGRIWVDSELGRGATFCFTIPFSSQPDSER